MLTAAILVIHEKKLPTKNSKELDSTQNTPQVVFFINSL